MSTSKRYEELLALMRRNYAPEYAYPTSTTAAFYKRSKTGCWFVSKRGRTINDPRTPVGTVAYETELEAELAAQEFQAKMADYVKGEMEVQS